MEKTIFTRSKYKIRQSNIENMYKTKTKDHINFQPWIYVLHPVGEIAWSTFLSRQKDGHHCCPAYELADVFVHSVIKID